MVMLTASLTALLALLSVTSSLALPTAPAQAHLAASPLLEADLLDDTTDATSHRSGTHEDLLDAWVGRLRGRVADPRSKQKSTSKTKAKSSGANDGSTLIPPPVLAGTASKAKGNHTAEKSGDDPSSESQETTKGKKKSGKKHKGDEEHAKRRAPGDHHSKSSTSPLLHASVQLSRSRMEKRHSHYHWHYPGVVVVKGSPSPDIIIESGHSAVVHVRRHHHEHIHIDSDHHGEVKDIDIDRRTIGNFGPAGAPWKRDDSGTPGMIDIFSSSMKVASLVLQQTNDTSGSSMFVMNASNGNNTGTVLKMVPVFNNSTLSSKRGDSNTTMVNFQMISPNSLDVFCMTFDPNPPAALPMTAEPCNNTVTLHKSQEFIHNAGTGAIAPLWNNSVPSSASKRQQPAESPSGAQNVTLIFTPVVESAQPSNKQLVATFLPGNGTTSSDPDSGDSQDSSDGEADSTDSPDGMSSTDTTTFSTSTDPSSTPASTSASPDSQPTDGTDPNSIYQEDVLPSNSVGSTTMSMTASFSTTMATETTDAMQTQTPSTTMTSTGPSSTDVADSSSPSPTGGAQQSFEWMFNAGM